MKAEWNMRPVTEFSALRAEWDRLNRSRSATALLDSRFVTRMLEYFSGGDENIVIGTRDDEVCALALVKSGGPMTITTFQPGQSPLGAVVASADLSPEDIAYGILRCMPKPVVLCGLTQLDPEYFPRPNENSRVHTLNYIETARITLDGAFENYWDQRGKNLKSNIRKAATRLERSGINVELIKIEAPEDIERGVADFGQLESAGWKGGEGTAVSLENSQGAFYTAVLRDFASNGCAIVYELLFDRKPVAVDLCLRDEHSLYVLKTTYDENERKSSPAMLLRRMAYEQLFQEKELQAIEFYGRAMEWHRRMTDDIRTIYHANVYRYTAIAALRKRIRRSVA